jgi:hypothetical protein
MDVRLFQIALDRDKNAVKFMDLETTGQLQRIARIDPSIYDEVFSGSVSCETLNEVFERFNTEGHPLHRGHSLSVSDVIGVHEHDNEKETFYFVDSIGFESVTFDPSLTHKPDDLIRIVMIEPGRAAYASDIKDSLEAMQRAVGGYIEYTYPFGDNAVVVGNDEAKLIGMEGNRKIGGDIYAGPIFIVGMAVTGEGAVNISLTDNQISHYTDMYQMPEQYTTEEVQDNAYIKIISF